MESDRAQSNLPYNNAGSISTRRILLAEDDKSCQKLVVCILKKAGFNVDLAENGNQVIEKVKANSYDLILMDMQMPGMDGLTAARTLRQMGFNELPILALTANAFTEDRKRCLDSGMNDFITKPVSPAKLTAQIEKWLTCKAGSVAK
jgi:CheY-like chemotaxis protein